MLCAQLAFVAMQAVVKAARESGLDPTEVMFFRTAPGLPVLWWLLRRQGFGLRAAQPGNVLVRSVLGSAAMGTNFTSMLWLTLAQFSTLGLSQPVFVALFAPLLLRERVTARTWLAILLAGSGAYVMVAPGLRAHALPWLAASLALSSALFSAFAHIWVRKATVHDPPERVVFYFAAWVSVLALALGIPRGYFSAVPAGLLGWQLGLLVLGMSVFGTLGQVLMTRAHVHGEASSVAMVSYSSVAFASVADVAFWGRPPEPSAFAGAVLMLAAGLVILWRGPFLRASGAPRESLSPGVDEGP
jgi:drug/metabolite transporter (DMT)-like permease